MNKRSLFPNFYPIDWKIFAINIISHLRKREVLITLKILISTFIRYIYPRLLGYLISPFFYKSSLKKKFLRLDLDHFGPIIYVYIFTNSPIYNKETKYYVCCCNFGNDKLLQIFPKNIIFIKNPLYWLLLGPLFFVKSISFQIYPFVRDYRLKIRRSIVGIESMLQNTSELKSRSIIKTDNISAPDWLNKLLKGRKYIIFYNREPGWHASISNSKRNIELDRFKGLMRYCNENKLAVIRIGGSYLRPAETYNLDNELIIDYPHTEHYSLNNDLIIWQNCEAVIGSVSGATHVPSIIFGKPALYFGPLQLHHILMLHGLIYIPGTIPNNVFFAPTPVTYNGEVMSLSNRLKREFIMNDAYDGLEMKQFDDNSIKNIGEFFIQHLGLAGGAGAENKIQRYSMRSYESGNNNLDYEIKFESGNFGQILVHLDALN
jgi:putative glycosyltransferase (TIGR04372 family)